MVIGAGWGGTGAQRWSVSARHHVWFKQRSGERSHTALDLATSHRHRDVADVLRAAVSACRGIRICTVAKARTVSASAALFSLWGLSWVHRWRRAAASLPSGCEEQSSPFRILSFSALITTEKWNCIARQHRHALE